MYVSSTLEECLLDLGECLSLDADDLPSAVHISPDTWHMMDIYNLLNLESDKLRFSVVPAHNIVGSEKKYIFFMPNKNNNIVVN